MSLRRWLQWLYEAKKRIAHPSQWPFSGYNEIQNPKRKNVLIYYEKLRELLAIDSYGLLKEY
ncbi:unnamed protein product, partial [marine sediment metagenome]